MPDEAHGIAERLRLVRSDLGLTQEDMADRFEIGHRTYASYELGTSMPKLTFVMKLMTLGYNADWILFGQGNKISLPLQKVDGYSRIIDEGLLSDVMEAVDAELDDRGLSLPVQTKARLITLLYEEVIEREAEGKKSPPDRRSVARFLRLVA